MLKPLQMTNMTRWRLTRIQGNQFSRESRQVSCAVGAASDKKTPLCYLSTNVFRYQENESSSSPLQLVRYKHSQRQVNRIYNKSPNRMRVLERERLARIGLPLQKPITAHLEVADLEYIDKKPRFEAIFIPKFLKNGWCAPASIAMDPPPSPPPAELYPFIVNRTGDKPNGAIGFLPVYCDFKHGKSQVTTLIRKVDFINPSYKKKDGDKEDIHGMEIFVEELKIHLAKWHKHRAEIEGRTLKKSALPDIRIRAGNQIEIMGNYSKQVKYWLASLGF